MFSLPVVASESDVAVTDEKTAIALGYGVQAYECDKKLNQLASGDRVTKIVGTVILICFVPNQEAMNDGIGLKEINNFKWETTTKDGDPLRRDAISNGKGDGLLSAVTCLNSNNPQDHSELEGKKICIMESMLGSQFYFDTASVMGSGEATLQLKDGVDGTVPVSVDIFQIDFSFKFTNGPDGAELTNEETKELLQSMHEHNAALESNSTSTGDEDESESLSASEEYDSVSNNDNTKETDNEDEGKDEL